MSNVNTINVHFPLNSLLPFFPFMFLMLMPFFFRCALRGYTRIDYKHAHLVFFLMHTDNCHLKHLKNTLVISQTTKGSTKHEKLLRLSEKIAALILLNNKLVSLKLVSVFYEASL